MNIHFGGLRRKRQELEDTQPAADTITEGEPPAAIERPAEPEPGQMAYVYGDPLGRTMAPMRPSSFQQRLRRKRMG